MSQFDSNANIYAIIIHHHNLTRIGQTVQCLLDEGLDSRRILLIDNSEDSNVSEFLDQKISNSVTLLYVANDGFGSAVNYGLSYLEEMGETNCKYLLVLTHESQIAPGALSKFISSLNSSPRNCAAGPLLKSNIGNTVRIFSAGGSLSRLTLLPRHFLHMEELDKARDRQSIESVDWLDQTLVIYRYEIIKHWRFDESFFMYSEEVELHTRMRRQGWRFINTKEVELVGFTNGVPISILVKQQRILRQRLVNNFRSRIFSLYPIWRNFLVTIKKAGTIKLLPIIRANLCAKIPSPHSSKSPRHIVIINPLGRSLKHYVESYSRQFNEIGIAVQVVSIDDPSQNSISRGRWILEYIGMYKRARKLYSPEVSYLVVWPFFGHVERIIASFLLRGRHTSIIHDPIPLVRNWGYSKSSRWLGKKFGSRSLLAVHSEDARKILRDQGLGLVQLLPHPFYPCESSATSKLRNTHKIVRVLGQYKKDRDLDLLKRVAEKLGDKYTFQIVGSGWDSVRGWEVINEFVSEETLDELISSSDLILIPYRNFFQSGIAIRALEKGTPFLAPMRSFFYDLLGEASPLLIQDFSDTEEWISKIESCLSAELNPLGEVLQIYKGIQLDLEKYVTE